ncbi:hypothetical protein H4S08_001391 [Coemansia sp. RSA 1365]|nr:hypothetical protein H4S08_001391 [Coemansia sp. RSA 1365]
MSLVANYQRLANLPTAQALCIWIGLPKLALYWPALLALAILFQLLRLSSNTLSSLVFGSRFDALTTRQKYDWGVRFVSQIHAIIVVVFAVPIFFKKELTSDTLYGFNNYAAGVYTVVCADIKRLGLGFVIHAIASFGVYILSFRPSLQYYGASFIMFEASTIFLNINWWLDKLGMTGSRLQLYNASALLSLYLIVRILFGTFMSYSMFKDLDTKGTQTSAPIYYFYRVANHTVLALSYYWFYLMIVAVKKRFPPARDPVRKKIE